MSDSSTEAASEGSSVLRICFCSLSNIPVAARITNLDMEKLFNARLFGRFIDVQSNLRRRNFNI